MIRRFEYVAGTSSNFWEVETEGRQVKVRCGLDSDPDSGRKAESLGNGIRDDRI